MQNIPKDSRQKRQDPRPVPPESYRETKKESLVSCSKRLLGRLARSAKQTNVRVVSADLCTALAVAAIVCTRASHC